MRSRHSHGTIAGARRASGAEPMNDNPKNQQWKRCPECGRSAYVRADGSLGRHTFHINRVMYVCPVGDGRDDVPKPWGRRTSVRIDVVIPKEWTDRELRLRAAQALREHLHNTFLVSLDID